MEPGGYLFLQRYLRFLMLGGGRARDVIGWVWLESRTGGPGWAGTGGKLKYAGDKPVALTGWAGGPYPYVIPGVWRAGTYPPAPFLKEGGAGSGSATCPDRWQGL